MHEMTFGDFLAVARKHLDDLEACYASGISGGGHLEEFVELHKDAGWALALVGSRGTTDLRAIETAAEGEFSPADFEEELPPELVDAIAADVEAGLTDLATLHEPADLSLGEAAAAAEARAVLASSDPGEEHDRWPEDWRRAVEEDDE